jgi:hypothetical protein
MKGTAAPRARTRDPTCRNIYFALPVIHLREIDSRPFRVSAFIVRAIRMNCAAY